MRNNKSVFLSIAFFSIISLFFVSSAFSEPAWQEVYSGSRALYDVFFINENTGWVSGSDSVILKTTNGGLNWLQQIIPRHISRINSIRFLNSMTGWAGGGHYIYYGGSNYVDYSFLCKTTNGGNNWIQVIDSQGPYINSIRILDSNTIFLTKGSSSGGSYYGAILKSTNAGLNFTSLQVPIPSSSFYVPFFLNSQTAWVPCYYCTNYVTNYFYIIKTTNGGINWSAIYADSNGMGNTCINFFDNNNGYFSNTQFYKSSNGGFNWNSSPLSGLTNFLCSNFSNAQTGWACGNTSSAGDTAWVYKTTNSGTNWLKSVNLGKILSANIFFLNSTKGWIVTGPNNSAGKIFRTTTGGTQKVIENSNLVPDNFSLSQNYPNPFNPATNIKYDLPKNGFVTVKIFDILGKEIETLVNEKQTPGTYEVNWNASRYPSGVYFYRLVTDGFTDTKKMILLK